MLEIVTLDEAKLFCRVDHDAEDVIISLLIGAAVESVVDFAEAWVPTGDVPDRIKLAVLCHIAQAYDDRGEGADMPASASRLLSPLRRLDI